MTENTKRIQFKKFFPIVLEKEQKGTFKVGTRKKDYEDVDSIPEYFKTQLLLNPISPIKIDSKPPLKKTNSDIGLLLKPAVTQPTI